MFKVILFFMIIGFKASAERIYPGTKYTDVGIYQVLEYGDFGCEDPEAIQKYLISTRHQSRIATGFLIKSLEVTPEYTSSACGGNAQFCDRKVIGIVLEYYNKSTGSGNSGPVECLARTAL